MKIECGRWGERQGCRNGWRKHTDNLDDYREARSERECRRWTKSGEFASEIERWKFEIDNKFDRNLGSLDGSINSLQ